jgi:hypothetical protein
MEHNAFIHIEINFNNGSREKYKEYNIYNIFLALAADHYTHFCIRFLTDI